MKIFTIHSLGCKVNQYDGQLLREHFLAAGYTEQKALWKKAADADEDVFVLNTCTVTEEADKECAYILRKVKRLRPAAKVVVTGCAVSAKDQDLIKRKDVDLFVANDKKGKLLDLYATMMGADASELPALPTAVGGFRGHCRAFVKIQDGCNEFCTFCKIPFVRGRNRSRPLEEIREEIQGLVTNGHQEIVLTGVHAGNFTIEPSGMVRSSAPLADLVENIHGIEGLRRIRFSSVEPMNLSRELIVRLSKFPKVCPHFHLPMQSGDDAVLRSMRRRYTVQRYREMAQDLRENFKDLEITTDVIVGFPGETEMQFDHTLNMVREIDFLKVHVFAYSSRPGTLASGFADTVKPSVLRARWQELTQFADRLAAQRRARYVGRTMQVLIEGKEAGRNCYPGFTANYLKVFVEEAGALVNRFADVQIMGNGTEGLIGKALFEAATGCNLPRGY